MGNDKDGPFVQRPGQYVTEKPSAESEVARVWKQAKLASLCIGLLYLIITACAVYVGKPVLYLAAAAAFVAIIVITYRHTGPVVEMDANGNAVYDLNGESRVTGSLAPTVLITGILLALFAIPGPHLIDLAWPERFSFNHWLVKAWVIVGLLVIFAPALLAAFYRSMSEIVDPLGPTIPRTAAPIPTTIWPWQAQELREMLNPPPESPDPPPPPRATFHTDIDFWTRDGDPGNGNTQARRQDRVGFDLHPAMLRRLAKMILVDGLSFCEETISGNGNLVSGRADYEKLRDELFSRHLAQWRNPDAHQQGIEFTRAGNVMLNHFLNDWRKWAQMPPHPGENGSQASENTPQGNERTNERTNGG